MSVRLERLLRQLLTKTNPVTYLKTVPMNRHLIFGTEYITNGLSGDVEKWSYEVPSGCRAVLDHVFINYRRTVIATSGYDRYELRLQIKNSQMNGVLLQKIYSGLTVGNTGELLLPSPIQLDEGDVLSGWILSGFADGQVYVRLLAVVAEYRKT
jgi:hypothetical protein